MAYRILVVDDEQDFLDSIRRVLLMAGYDDICLKRNPLEALALFQGGQAFDLALLDVSMPEMSGMDLLESIKLISPATECVIVTASTEVKTTVECIKMGAYDYLVKPLSRDDLLLTVARALEHKRLLDVLLVSQEPAHSPVLNKQAFAAILSSSQDVLRVLREAELHARSEVPILITGESGTGKELLARAIHKASLRSTQPFIPVNMGSLSGTLFDAEFFGHTRGAFTGAEKDRAGCLEFSNHGTLFLDEIGNLSQELQSKLLRVLQEGEFFKLGSSRPHSADIRFIAATNQNLEKEVARGHFRKDLYYRLKGAWLHLPALRERREDVALLVKHFLREFEGKGIDAEAMDLLVHYPYPGNIRELRAIVRVAVNLAQGRPISPQCLPDQLKSHKTAQNGRTAFSRAGTSLAEVEREHILRVYEQTGSNKSQTARILDIGLNTLRRKLESYGVE